jgi:hypothetical protein
MRAVEIELLQPPGQQVVRPFAGKNTEIRGANGQVVALSTGAAREGQPLECFPLTVFFPVRLRRRFDGHDLERMGSALVAVD